VRIAAALSWWNERPEDLIACVRGVAEIADRIVAVDGAYARYPGATVTSPPDQAEAIRATASAAGLECVIVEPNRLWAGQVAKRSVLLAEAAKGSDWIAIVDADWIIHADRDAARAELQTVHEDVVSVPMWTPASGQEPATGWHRKVAGSRSEQAHLFRPLPELRAETMHAWYSALVDGERVWAMKGNRPHRRVLDQHRLRARYEIEHRSLFRTEEQCQASRAFCNDRELVLALTGQEDDMPGLPPPAFDYVTVPY
jgi:hypothetical protein